MNRWYYRHSTGMYKAENASGGRDTQLKPIDISSNTAVHKQHATVVTRAVARPPLTHIGIGVIDTVLSIPPTTVMLLNRIE